MTKTKSKGTTDYIKIPDGKGIAVSELEKYGYRGADENLETSLDEYGLVWVLRSKKPNLGVKEYHFIYPSSSGVGCSWCVFDQYIDPKMFFGWVKDEDWIDLADSYGMTLTQYFEQELCWIVSQLCQQFGRKVFGE